jgi:hypothetical protein
MHPVLVSKMSTLPSVKTQISPSGDPVDLTVTRVPM